MTDHYDTLGVSKDATAEDIKKAYRKGASQNHPDRGGNPEAMQKINQAYAVLADPERRAEYDQTGHDSEHASPEREAANVLMNVFAEALNQDNIDSVKYARQWAKGKGNELRHAIDENRRRIKKLTNRRDKVRTKKGKNLMHALIDHQLQQITEACFTMEKTAIVVNIILSMLDDYESDEVPPPAPPSASAYTAGPMSGGQFFGGIFGFKI